MTSATLTCSCRHTVPGMSPGAHTGDGATDLIIVHKTSYINYFRYLFRTAFHTEHPFSLPFVEAVRVKQWDFQPQVPLALARLNLDQTHKIRIIFSISNRVNFQGENEKNSTWNCDGEILSNPQTFVRAHRQLVPVFAR